jgi:hypothetical protein
VLTLAAASKSTSTSSPTAAAGVRRRAKPARRGRRRGIPFPLPGQAARGSFGFWWRGPAWGWAARCARRRGAGLLARAVVAELAASARWCASKWRRACVGPDGLWRACGRGVASAAWALDGAAVQLLPSGAPRPAQRRRGQRDFGLLPRMAGGASGGAPPSTRSVPSFCSCSLGFVLGSLASLFPGGVGSPPTLCDMLCSGRFVV